MQTCRTDLETQLCKEESDRAPAAKLSQEVRTKYPKSIGRCCKEPPPKDLCLPNHNPSPQIPPEPRRVPMGFSMPRPVVSWRIGRREPRSGFPKSPNYEEYSYFADYVQDGELELRENGRDDAWAATRTIIIKISQSPRSIDEQCRSSRYPLKSNFFF